MHISFDLDSTLIPAQDEFVSEKRALFAKYFGVEKIRKGTPSIISDLQKEGHHIHIYTTSYRSKIKIRCTLLYYGISVSRIVTQHDNDRVLKPQRKRVSKYPPAFGFDLHIDDSHGVRIEGEKSGFNTLILNPNDTQWISKIRVKVNSSN